MAVAHLYSIESSQAQAFTMCYKDDEGDSCTLTEATLADCLSFAADSKNVLRLQCSWPPGTLIESAIQSDCSEEQPKLNMEHETSCEADRVVAPESHGRITQEVESEAAEARTLQDQVAQTVDDVIAAAAGARARFNETNQDLSERLARGVAELRASTSNVRTTGQDLSASMRGFMAQQVAKVRRGRPGKFDEPLNSTHMGTQEFADRVQVQISELAVGARAAAANVREKATAAYEQASEGDSKSALGLAAAAAVPAVAVAIAPVRCLAFAAVAVAAAGAVDLISNNNFDPTEFAGSETAYAEDDVPAEPVATDDSPHMTNDTPDDVTDGVTDENSRPQFSG